MTQRETEAAVEQGSLAKAGKYLTFAVGGETYGAAILQIREIIGSMEITTLPRSAECMLGVINLRDEIIPVMDLRRRFAMAAPENHAKGCTVVVEVRRDGRTGCVGLSVDGVSEVLDISTEQIEETPDLGVSVQTGFVAGIAKVGAGVVVLLDVQRLLANQAGVSGSVVRAVAA